MAVPSGGSISMSDFHAAFGLEYNLAAYRGVVHFKSDNVRRVFSSGAIDFASFYDAMPSRPVSPTGDVQYGNGTTFTVPYYNVLIVTAAGGQAGYQGNQGYTNDGCGGDPTGANGNPGGTTTFATGSATYVSSPGGAPNGNAGSQTVTYIYADSTPGAPTRGTGIGVAIGGGGNGGRGGDQTGKGGGTWCGNFGKAGTGAGGNPGYLYVRVQ